MAKMSYQEIKDNSLNLTSKFETSTAYPDNFGVTAGNFDGAGMSWGAIQYNFYSGTLQPIMKDLFNNYPDVVRGAFTNQADHDYFKGVIFDFTKDQQIQFGQNITDPNNDHKVVEPWNTYFHNLGVTNESIVRQKQGAEWYHSQARIWFDELGLYTLRGYALLFDIAVQSGNIPQSAKDLMWSDFGNISTSGKTAGEIETEKMVIIANRQADTVNIEWRESYRERKLSVAEGSGWVYGGTLFMDTTEYGMTLDPAFPEGEEEVIDSYNPSDFPARTEEYLYGIDVSEYQGNINYQTAKDKGVNYAILRAYGAVHNTGGDSRAAEYYQGFKNVGIPCGSYFYAWIDQVNDLSSARFQADLYADKLEEIFGVGNYGDLMPFLDLESNQSAIDSGLRTPTSGISHDNLDTALMLKWADEFKRHFENRTGRKLGLYTAHYFVSDVHNQFNEGVTTEGNILKKMPLWVAAFDKYGYTQPLIAVGGWEEWLLYQYSEDGSGTEHGVSSATIDLNRSKPIEWLRPPLPISNLTAQPNVEGNMNLSWKISPDEDIFLYHVFVDGQWVKDLPNTSQSYVIEGLTEGVEYSFSVLTQDRYMQNTQSKTVIKTMSIDTNVAPATPTGLVATPADTKVVLNWNANTDTIYGYNVYVDGAWYIFTEETKVEVLGLDNDIQYGFQIDADNGANSLKTEIVYATPIENVPNKVYNLTHDVNNDKTVTFIWNHDPKTDFSHYEIYKNGVLFIDNITLKEHTFDVIEYNVQAEYTVNAVDINGRRTIGDPISVIVRVPNAPTNLQGTPQDTAVHLTWDAYTENWVTGFNIFDFNWNYLTTVSTNEATITGLVNGTEYSFRVQAFSSEGNTSGSSTVIYVTPVLDFPNPPENFTAVLNPDRSVLLDWDHVPTASFSHFRITQNGVVIVDNYAYTGYDIATLEDNTSYDFVVYSVDTEGDEAKSRNVLVKLNVPAPISTISVVNGDREVTLVWSKSPEEFVEDYDVYVNGEFYKNTSLTEAVVTNLDNGTEYNFSVYPVSDQGYSPDTSVTVSGTPVASYPNMATNVQATITKDRGIQLSWDHNPKQNFSHFRIYVGGILHKDGITTKTWTLKNVSYNTDLSINVVTVDNYNRETWSQNVYTRIDVPVAPSGVIAEGKNREVALSWNASPEAFVVGYGVYERGSWYDYTTGTSINIPFKTNNVEYSYQVVAITDKEIFSDKSEEVFATPRVILPSLPEITYHDELGTGEVTLHWDHVPKENFSHFKLYQNGFVIGDNIKDNFFTTLVLEPNTSHTFNVEALNKFGDSSGWSNNYSLIVQSETLVGTDDGLGLGEINLNKKPIKPQLFLCKPNYQTVAKLTEAYNVRQNTRLADINELHFELPYKIEKNKEIITNPHINLLKERFLIRVELGEKKEYYLITKTNDVSNDTSDVKEISAFSLGYELRDFVINNYDELPKPLKEHCQDLLLNTTWSVGMVDEAINEKNRPFEANNRTLLDVIKDLAETYDAVILWDSLNRIVHFKDINNIGDNKGLKLSYGKYLTNIGKESSADEMVTQLIPKGKDGLTIRSVMPTGSEYLESFDYFTHPFERDAEGNVLQSSPYMTDSLAGALIDYKEFIESQENNFSTLNDKLKTLENDLFREDTKLFELEGDLITVQGLVNAFKASQTLFYFNRTFTGKRIIVDQPLKHEFNYAVMIKVSDKNNITVKLSGVEKSVYTDEWVILGKIAKGTVDDPPLASISIEGTASNVEVDILITEIRQEEFDEENNDYDLINKYNEIQAEKLMNEQKEVVESLESEKDSLLLEIDTLKENLKLEKFFTEEQLIERNHFIIQRTWNNEHITNPEELRIEAEKEFRKLQEPNVVITTNIVNLLEIVEEQRNWKKLKLGDVIIVHHEKINVDIQAKIAEIDYNYEQGEISLTITNLDDIKTDREKFLSALYGAISTSTSVQTEKYKWDQSVQTAKEVEDFMNRSFDATKQTIVAGTNESIEISRRGLLIRDKDDPDNFLIGQHKVLAITNDGGKSYKNAITTDGVVGERLYGRILAGVNLVIENVGGTFKVDENGVVIDGSALQIIGGIGDENLNIDRSGQTAFMENYSEANDKIAVPPSLPEISTLGDAVQHTINTDGSANISFEWQFVDDDLDENNIDGFIVYVYQSSSSAEYAFGTNEINEFSYNVTPRKRSITIYSLPADRYYSFGVKAYRMVDEEVSVDGYLDTAIVTVGLAQQNPYKPILFTPYDGDIRGTINEYTNVDIRDQSFNSVLLGHSYNNISIDINSGLVATKDNDLVRTIMNATDGMKIQTRESIDLSYNDVFYVDTTGQLVAEGMKAKSLQIEDENGNLIIDAKEGVFNLDFLNSINGTFPEGSLVIGSETTFRSGYDPKELLETGIHVLADSPNGMESIGGFHWGDSNGLHLTNETTINISYVTMYATLDNPDVKVTGLIQLIRKDTGEVVENKEVYLDEGYNRVLLNFLLRKDVGEYFLGVSGDFIGGQVYRSTTSATLFPYSNGSFTIVDGGSYSLGNDLYYWFYDIAISGERVEGTFINDKTLESWKIQENGETRIDGGRIYTESVTADKLNVKGLTVNNGTENTLIIDSEGNVSLTGNISMRGGSIEWTSVTKPSYVASEVGAYNTTETEGKIAEGIDSIEIGGENLQKNTDFEDLTEWTTYANRGIVEAFTSPNGVKGVELKAYTSGDQIGLLAVQANNTFPVIKGKEYTFSAIVTLNGVSDLDFDYTYIIYDSYSNPRQVTKKFTDFKVYDAGENSRLAVWTFVPFYSDNIRFMIGATLNTDQSFTVRKFKVEEGNKPTSWKRTEEEQRIYAEKYTESYAKPIGWLPTYDDITGTKPDKFADNTYDKLFEGTNIKGFFYDAELDALALNADFIKTGHIGFDQARGGTLTLGGKLLNPDNLDVEEPLYENGVLVVRDEENGEIARLDGNYGGFGSLRIDILQNTQNVVFSTYQNYENADASGNWVFYIDPNDGSDSDNGTSDKPLMTVTEALRRIPKYLDRNVFIYYVPTLLKDNVIEIDGFVGKGKIIFRKWDLTVRYIRDWTNGNSSNYSNHTVEVQARRGTGSLLWGDTQTNPDNVTTNAAGTVLNLQYVSDNNTSTDNYADLGSNNGNPVYTLTYLRGGYDNVDSVSVWHWFGTGGSRTYYGTKTEVSADKIKWYTIFDSERQGLYAEQVNGHVINMKQAYLKGRLRVISNSVDVEISNLIVDSSDESASSIYLERTKSVYLFECIGFNNTTNSYVCYNNGSLVRLQSCEFNNAKTACVISAYGGTTYLTDCIGGNASYGIYAFGGCFYGSGTAPKGNSINAHPIQGGQFFASFSHVTGNETPVTTVEKTGSWSSIDSHSWDERINNWKVDDKDPLQGKYDIYGHYRGCWFFGTGVQSAVNGKKIKSIKVFVTRANQSGDAGSSTVVLRWHEYSTKPDYAPFMSGEYVEVGLSRGESRWVDVTTKFKAVFESGQAFGIACYTTSLSSSRYVRMTQNAKIEIVYEDQA